MHPEISHLAKEERIRLIAYAIWEEEGRPDGRAEAHWLQACSLVESETQAADPEWLKPNEPPAAEAVTAAQVAQGPKVPLTEAIKRMRGSRAA